jgi:hypothetical protein
VARSIIPLHEPLKYFGSMEPIGAEHATSTPGVKPSMVAWPPDEVAVADAVGLPEVVALTDVVAAADVVGLSEATQPRRVTTAASVAVSIRPVLSNDRDGDRPWTFG